MADVRTTLLDIAMANCSDPTIGLIEECTKAHPELTLGAARTIKGQQYRTLVRVGLPTVSFRNANEGVAASKSAYENRLVETFILNPRWEADRAVADSSEDGPEAAIAREAKGQLEAAFQLLAKQFYYGRGTGGDAKGYPGLLQAYDATNMVVDAGGTTAGTGSSVWAVKFGPDAVQWVWGQNGSLEPEPVRIESVLDASSNRFTAYVQEMLAYPGVQVGSVFSCGRIKKVTADSGKTLTDAMINSLLAKFPTGTQPDVLFMSRRSLAQLQSSRTATSPTGQPAPFPTAIVGIGGANIPISVTDAILDTEALTL